MKAIYLVLEVFFWVFLVVFTAFAAAMLGLGIGQFVWDYLKMAMVLMMAGVPGGIVLAE